MSGIAPEVLLGVTRLRVTFRDGIGNPKKIVGTGFWVADQIRRCFVTNRHNLDPAMKLGTSTMLRLSEVEIEYRFQEYPGNWRPEREFVRVEDIESSLVMHDGADVAVFRNPSLIPSDPRYSNNAFPILDIATQEFLQNSVNPMDIASFVGFPGKDGKHWTDRKWGLPISRTGHISSWPKLAFENDSIPTTDTMLISGLSFSGSSGSPVILHEKGIKAAPPLVGTHVSPKIIGIMSGHWWNEEPSQDMFVHSGLSYLTRATAIRELLDAKPSIATDGI